VATVRQIKLSSNKCIQKCCPLKKEIVQIINSASNTSRHLSTLGWILRPALLVLPLVAFIILFFAITQSHTQLKVYYVSSAEYGHNIEANWAGVPEDPWPAYVGDPKAFTPAGKLELAGWTWQRRQSLTPNAHRRPAKRVYRQYFQYGPVDGRAATRREI